MKLFRKNKSKYYGYDFTVRSQRYRRSSKETDEARAQKAAALKLAAAIKGSEPLDKKPPILREYSKDFMRWVDLLENRYDLFHRKLFSGNYEIVSRHRRRLR